MKRWKSFAFLLAAVFCALPAAADAAITEEMVKRAWTEVTRIAEMDPLPLSIENNKVPNAWVTAGKSVTVTTGLMQLLEREEEIFGVLSHEAGHAKLKHYEGRVQNAVGINIAASLLSKAAGSKAIGDAAIGVGANLAAAGYSREQEVAADDFAVDLAFKGKQDPTGIYTALKRLSLYGGESQPSGFNSHPPDARRLQHVANRIHANDPDVAIPEVEVKKEEKEKEQTPDKK